MTTKLFTVSKFRNFEQRPVEQVFAPQDDGSFPVACGGGYRVLPVRETVGDDGFGVRDKDDWGPMDPPRGWVGPRS